MSLDGTVAFNLKPKQLFMLNTTCEEIKWVLFQVLSNNAKEIKPWGIPDIRCVVVEKNKGELQRVKNVPEFSIFDLEFVNVISK